MEFHGAMEIVAYTCFRKQKNKLITLEVCLVYSQKFMFTILR